MGLIIQILIAIVFSAFFSGMEIAFVSSNKLRFEMEKGNNISTSIISKFFHNPNTFISTMLVGNNIALVIYGIKMAELIDIYIIQGHIDNQALVVLIETVISTLIIIVTGEFMPKTLFKINPNFTLRLLSVPTYLCYIILYPISRFTSFISGIILRLTGNKINKEATDKAFTKVDLDYYIQSSIDEIENEEEIDTEVKIFQNALDFSSIKVRDCMIPRTEIIAIDVESSLEDLKDTFIKHGISKIVVYNENIDNVTGYIHSSEMFRKQDKWQDNIRPLPIVPESMSAHKLMQLFMQQKRSIAIVVDEFGGTSGIVALEDLVEEIFGDIEDEHDTKSIIAKALGNDEFILSGRLEIEKANELFDLDLPENDEYQTIGGLILHEYQSIPKVHEQINIDKFRFIIVKGTATKIELVKLKVQK